MVELSSDELELALRAHLLRWRMRRALEATLALAGAELALAWLLWLFGMLHVSLTAPPLLLGGLLFAASGGSLWARRRALTTLFTQLAGGSSLLESAWELRATRRPVARALRAQAAAQLRAAPRVPLPWRELCLALCLLSFAWIKSARFIESHKERTRRSLGAPLVAGPTGRSEDRNRARSRSRDESAQRARRAQNEGEAQRRGAEERRGERGQSAGEEASAQRRRSERPRANTPAQQNTERGASAPRRRLMRVHRAASGRAPSTEVGAQLGVSLGLRLRQRPTRVPRPVARTAPPQTSLSVTGAVSESAPAQALERSAERSTAPRSAVPLTQPVARSERESARALKRIRWRSYPLDDQRALRRWGGEE